MSVRALVSGLANVAGINSSTRPELPPLPYAAGRGVSGVRLWRCNCFLGPPPFGLGVRTEGISVRVSGRQRARHGWGVGQAFPCIWGQYSKTSGRAGMLTYLLIHRLGTFIPGLATQLHLPPSVAPMGLVSSHANTHANAKRLRFRCLLGSAIPVKAVANVAELIWLDVAMRRCSTPGSLFTASRGGMTPSTPFRDRVERPHGSRSG